MVNAFWLDRDLETATAWLVDAHVLSSVFEGSMVLTTAARTNGYPDPEGRLPFTHADHPLTRWAAESLANWRHLRSYVEHAHREWRYRWDHAPDERHGSWAHVESLDEKRFDSLEWPAEGRSDPPQVTGQWTADDYVEAYRLYYANEKRNLFEWSKDRARPPWLDEYTVDDGGGGIGNDAEAGDGRDGGVGDRHDGEGRVDADAGDGGGSDSDAGVDPGAGARER